MSKKQFSMVLRHFGVDTACYAARLLGVPEARIGLWLRSPCRPVHRKHGQVA